MLTISSSNIRTGGVPVASKVATWFFPKIHGKFLNRSQLMASIRQVYNELLPEQHEPFFQLLLANRPGVVQKKYRRFKLERLYDFNLSKILTAQDLQLVVEEFNKTAGANAPRLAVVKGLFSVSQPEKTSAPPPQAKPETLNLIIDELFSTTEAPLSRDDFQTHLRARGISKKQRTRGLDLELGKKIGSGTVQVTTDEKYYLTSRQAVYISSGLLIELSWGPGLEGSTLATAYVSRAGLEGQLEQGRLLPIITPDTADPRYCLAESVAGLLERELLCVVVRKNVTPAYCLAADLNHLLAGDQVVIGLDAYQRELIIEARSERAFQPEVFEYYLNSLRASLKLKSTDQDFLAALRDAFKIGISYQKGVRVVDFCYQAIRVSRLTGHRPALLAALLCDVPLAELRKHLSADPCLAQWAEEIYEGLESYHLVRQLPFFVPDKKTHHHQNYMDLLVFLSGTKSRGQNPVAFILNFAEKLKKARAATEPDYPGKIEELRLFAILAERSGQKDLADDLRSQYFRLHDPAAAHEVRTKRELLLGTTFTQAQIELAAFCRELKSELARVMPEAPVEIFSRIKSYYAIWQKVVRRRKYSIEELTDLRGARVVTDDLGHLYEIVGHLVSQHMAPGTAVEDYVNKVKASGWRAINIPCFYRVGQEVREVEIQVMTREMQEEDRRGAAAHWIKRAVEETGQVFDQDPADIIGLDLAETFRRLWPHVNSHTRLLYLGENLTLKDLQAWLAGNLSSLLLRLPPEAIPADVAADRAVDKLSLVDYQGLIIYALKVNPKTNQLEIAASQAGAKVAEDTMLASGWLTSVKTTGSGYLSQDNIRRIEQLAKNFRTKYITHLLRQRPDKNKLANDQIKGKRLIGLSDTDQLTREQRESLIRALRRSPFKTAEELLAAIGLGLYPLENVKPSLDQLRIKLIAEPRQDGLTVNIHFTAPDRPGLLQALLQSAPGADLISFHHQTLNLADNTRVAEATLTLKGTPRIPVPVSSLAAVLEKHVKETVPPADGLSEVINYRVDFTASDWQPVPPVLAGLFALGINIFGLTLEDCAKPKIARGFLYLEADPALTAAGILLVLAPLGRNLHLKEV